MAKKYRIHIHGEQREVIDADLMAQLVVMLGRQLAKDAKEAAEAARRVPGVHEVDQDEHAVHQEVVRRDDDRAPGRETGGLA